MCRKFGCDIGMKPGGTKWIWCFIVIEMYQRRTRVHYWEASRPDGNLDDEARLEKSEGDPN
jgi:hypothetical protein